MHAILKNKKKPMEHSEQTLILDLLYLWAYFKYYTLVPEKICENIKKMIKEITKYDINQSESIDKVRDFLEKKIWKKFKKKIYATIKNNWSIRNDIEHVKNIIIEMKDIKTKKDINDQIETTNCIIKNANKKKFKNGTTIKTQNKIFPNISKIWNGICKSINEKDMEYDFLIRIPIEKKKEVDDKIACDFINKIYNNTNVKPIFLILYIFLLNDIVPKCQDNLCYSSEYFGWLPIKNYNHLLDRISFFDRINSNSLDILGVNKHKKTNIIKLYEDSLKILNL